MDVYISGADAMVNVMAHELTETITDPNLDTWQDASGNENAGSSLCIEV